MKSSFEQANRLIEHARSISQDIYKLSIELTERNKGEAEKKLAYGKKVLESLESLPQKYLSAPDGGQEFLDVIYLNYISIKPTLSNAILDLQKRLDANEFFKDPVDNPISEEDLLKDLDSNYSNLEKLTAEFFSDLDPSQIKDMLNERHDYTKDLPKNNDEDESSSSGSSEEEDEEESEAESEPENMPENESEKEPANEVKDK